MPKVIEISRRVRRPTRSPINLTAARIRSLKPGPRRYWQADAGCPGLYVRIEPSGESSFYVRGRIGTGRGARQRNIRLGDVRAIGLSDARSRAMSFLSDMRSGVDPLERERETLTIYNLMAGYVSDLDNRGVVNARHIASSLRRHLEEYEAEPADILTRADFVRAIERCRRNSGPAAANAFRGFAAAMLNWAVNTGELKASVLAGYKAPRRTKAERLAGEDQYTLIGAENIRMFWTATEAASPVFRDYLRFVLLTGQRRSETATIVWEDVSDDRWTIRAEVAKAGREHIVPLGPLSRPLLDAQVRSSPLVWPGRGDVPMAGWSKRLRPVKSAMGEPRLAMHALRRGYRTGIRELGGDTDLCEIMIGHARRGLIARYDKSEMWDARVALQEKWERSVEVAVSSRFK